MDSRNFHITSDPADRHVIKDPRVAASSRSRSKNPARLERSWRHLALCRSPAQSRLRDSLTSPLELLHTENDRVSLRHSARGTIHLRHR